MKQKKPRRGGWPAVDRLESRSYLSAVSFNSPTFLTGIDNVTGIAVGELTGNGRDDLVAAGQVPESANSIVAVFLSAAGGTFSTPTIIPIAGTTGGVALGDFLGNGHEDVAAVEPTDNALDVFLNDGSGNLSQGVGASLGGSGTETSIATGDFNHDSKQDLAVVDPAGNAIRTFISTGDAFGTFTAGGTVSVPSPQKVIAADLDGDGFADLVILSSASPNSIYVALNNGNGSFASPTPYTLEGNFESINDIAVATFDSDAFPDLVALGTPPVTNAGLAAVLLNQGNGSFGPPALVTVATGASLVATGTFSGSGNQDIASISSTGALDIVAGDGAGEFGQDQSLFTTQLGAPGPQAVTGDFNGDGLPDIAFASSSSGSIGVLLNTSGVQATPQNVSAALAGPAVSLVVAGLPLKLKEKLTLTAGNTAVSGNATAHILLSPDDSAADSVLTLSTTATKLKLKAGKAKTFSLKLLKVLPTTIAAGSYHVLIDLTDTAEVSGTIDSGQTFTIAAPVVNLTGSFVKVPTSAKAGKKFTATFLVTNSTGANVPALGFLPFDIETSPDGQLSDAVLLAASRKHINLKPGKSIKITITQTLSSSAFLIVNLDPGHIAFGDDENSGTLSFATANEILIS